MKTTETFNEGVEYFDVVEFFIDYVSPHTKEYGDNLGDDPVLVLDKKITITIEIS